MFGSIARRYDFLNHLLSINIDRRWRNKCLRELAKMTAGSDPRTLDVGCGTADLALAFSRIGPVVACDFCRPMLRVAADKVNKYARQGSIVLVEADALALPFVSNSFDIVVSAFVLRNLSDIKRGLQEMRRVLRAGGILGILEFAMPDVPVFSALYRIYFIKLLPRIGKLISGAQIPYGYLPASVQSFYTPDELVTIIRQTGFAKVRCRRLTGGVAVLYTGVHEGSSWF